MTGGAHTLEGDDPVVEPEYGHHHDAYRLSQRRCDALGADRLVRLPEQSNYGIAKLVQAPGSDGARVPN